MLGCLAKSGSRAGKKGLCRGTPDAQRPSDFRNAVSLDVLTLEDISVSQLAVLAWTGKRVDIDRAAVLTAQGVAAVIGADNDSQVARGLSSVARQLWPPVLAERTDLQRIANFDREHLPAFSHIEIELSREPSQSG